MTRRTHRPLAAALAALILAAPAAARTDEPAPPPDLSERLGDAAREALERLREEMAPLLDRLEGALSTLEQLDDYGPPRVLPNGDILIPRKPEAGPPPGAQEPPADSDRPPETLDL